MCIRDRIYDLADRHGVEITDYKEAQAAELLIIYAGTELNDDGEYYDVKREKYATFLSASEFSRIAGEPVSLKPGEYKACLLYTSHWNIDRRIIQGKYAG